MPLNSLIAGYEITPLSLHNSDSIVQSMLTRGFSLRVLAEIHSGSKALLASLLDFCQRKSCSSLLVGGMN